ncbi:uncharacterized protein CELE_W06D11.1 [Caenorhabditis elegans]|uniref:Uncharacterized protein n=1 Tax=Caenorhabditis elegans TaxID=6239 RepID=G5EGF5_CAEEL|nr:Uncharacterized protein CELE_W06D11.1 [Caenorhabditis elegans]CAA93539.2 Uncharacterized protein CELE_W06D11.1 [Caenorhabditis elegans]
MNTRSQLVATSQRLHKELEPDKSYPLPPLSHITTQPEWTTGQNVVATIYVHNIGVNGRVGRLFSPVDISIYLFKATLAEFIHVLKGFYSDDYPAVFIGKEGSIYYPCDSFIPHLNNCHLMHLTAEKQHIFARVYQNDDAGCNKAREALYQYLDLIQPWDFREIRGDENVNRFNGANGIEGANVEEVIDDANDHAADPPNQ